MIYGLFVCAIIFRKIIEELGDQSDGGELDEAPDLGNGLESTLEESDLQS